MSSSKDDSGTEELKRASTGALRTIVQGNEGRVEVPPGPTGLGGKHLVDFRLDRDKVIDTLRTHEPELRGRGVLHVALFGSLARGEAGPDSDIDVMVEFAPDTPVDLFDYVALTEYIADLFPVKVDVANREGLKPLVRPSAERDAIYAF